VVIDIEAGGSWRINKEVVRERILKRNRYNEEELVETVEGRGYLVNNRFIVKCHREGGGYACYLCFRNRETDTMCETMEMLINHVCKKHDITEYDCELDIKALAAIPFY
jgi:predicted metalloprotease